MINEVELVIVGRVTDGVRKTLFENFNNIRSKGFKRVNLRFFTEEPPLKCLEEVRDLLLSNIVLSINLYEHELKELRNVLGQLIRQGKNIVLVGDKELLPPHVADSLESLMGSK